MSTFFNPTFPLSKTFKPRCLLRPWKVGGDIIHDASQTARWPQGHQLDMITCRSTESERGIFATTRTIDYLRCKLRANKVRKRKGKKSTKAKDTIHDDMVDMSESERIAYHYRNSDADSGFTSSDLEIAQVSSVTEIESCQPQCIGMGQTSESCVPTDPRSSRLRNMLCSASPMVIENAREDADLHNVLKPYRFTPGNIVLDSQCPAVAPHIVITPPSVYEALAAPYVAQNNRIPQQTWTSLTVPPFYMGTCRMPNHFEWSTVFYPPPPSPKDQYETQQGAGLPFTRSLSRRWVKRVEAERECMFFHLLLPVLTRHTAKVAAFAASSAAQVLRLCYDAPGFVESMETPFQWSDPAEALLSLYHRHPVGIHHIPSQEPFSVPHILVEESWPNDYRITEANAAPLQDCAGREILVVLSSRRTAVSYLNDPQYIDNEDYPHHDSDDESSSYGSSEPEVPRPETPNALQRVDSGFFSFSILEEDEEEEDDITSAYPSYATQDRLFFSADELLSSEFRDDVKARFFIDEDEDDGPPEYDEWFQAIADRTSLREAEEADAASSCRSI